MATITKAIDNLLGKMRETAGIARASQVQDHAGTFPWAVAYPGSGDLTIGNPAGVWKAVHTITLEVHVSRLPLSTAYEDVTPIFEAVAAAILADPTLGGQGTIAGSIDFVWTALGWAEQDTLGWRFSIPFKIQNTT